MPPHLEIVLTIPPFLILLDIELTPMLPAEPLKEISHLVAAEAPRLSIEYEVIREGGGCIAGKG